MLHRHRRWRLVLIPGVAVAWLAMVFAPSAQAYWDYQYFSGYSASSQYWTSANGNEEGGSVYTILGEGYSYTATEYTDMFDAGTGILISSASGATNQTTSQWSAMAYGYQQCYWNSYPYISGTPSMNCDDWADW